MKPIDFRNETFADIYSRLNDDRQAVYRKMMSIGDSTTRDLAKAMDMDILAVRPRVTELYQLGAVDLVDRHGHEGVYRARSQGDWMLWFGRQKNHDTNEQTLLEI